MKKRRNLLSVVMEIWRSRTLEPMLPFGLVCADPGCMEPGELVFEDSSFFLGCS